LGGQVDPLLIAVAQKRQADPLQHSVFVTSQVENGVGGSAVEKMQSSPRSLSHQHKTADAMSGHSGQIIVSATQGKAEQIDEALFAAGQVTAQSQQTLPVLAKRIEADGDRPAIRPKHLISFKGDIATSTVFRRVAPK
jgi:hypothetical protein